MRNEGELKKLFPKFKKHLNERLSQATNSTLEFEFLAWWCETNYDGYVSLDYTDAKGDGKIDAVVQRPNGDLIAVQAKYNDGYAKIPGKNISLYRDKGSSTNTSSVNTTFLYVLASNC